MSNSKETESIELKLIGDKIKLESRPASRESTTSAKCAYLVKGPSRPSSAVPILSFYNSKDEYDLSVKSRRPYSAEEFRKVALSRCKSRSSTTLATGSEDASSLQSIEELDQDLSSSDLLKTLLAEPIVSWRNGTPSSDHSMQSNMVKEQTIVIADPKPTIIPTPSINLCPLLPGLKSKPPLPKKVELKVTDSAKKAEDQVPQYEEEVNKLSSERNKSITQYEATEELCVQKAELLEELRKQEETLGLTPHKQPSCRTSKLTFEEFFNLDMQNSSLIDDVESPTMKEAPNNVPQSKDGTSKLCKQTQATPKSTRNKSPKVAKIVPPKFKVKAIKDTVESPRKDVASIEAVETWISRDEKTIDAWDEKPTIHKVQFENDTPSDSGITCQSPEDEDQSSKDCSSDTYDEIASVLEVLEAQTQKSKSKIQSIKKIVSTELNATINSIPKDVTKMERKSKASHKETKNQMNNSITEARIHGSKISTTNEVLEVKPSTYQNGLAKTANFNELLVYLDEIEKNSAESIYKVQENVVVASKILNGSIRIDTIPKSEDLLVCSPKELAKQITELHLRLKEKTSVVHTLQAELSNLREKVMRMSKDAEHMLRDKLKDQKQESDEVVKRHQKFIDQLICDKKTLNRQCETLIAEMRGLEERFASNMQAQEHKHKIEMQKLKDMQAVGERMRRERWVDAKTQKIKEMTVKSIEPELQSMTLRHERELGDLRALHKREIEDIDIKNARRMQHQCEALRDQLTDEREKAVTHERELLRSRYETMVEAEEKGIHDQRKRLIQDHAARLQELQAKEDALLLEKEDFLRKVREEFEEKIKHSTKKQEQELACYKDMKDHEFGQIKAELLKRYEADLSTKEAQIREKCKRERDKEIEVVIERLEREASDSKTQIEEATENRIRRLKEKFERELKDLEQSEKRTNDRFLQMKTRLAENEETMATLRAYVKNLEIEVKEKTEMCMNLNKERDKIKETMRNEVKQDLDCLEKEIETIKNDRDNELRHIYARVKVAVAKKDELLTELTRDNVSLQEKCRYLENMLEQQRKEYFIK